MRTRFVAFFALLSACAPAPRSGEHVAARAQALTSATTPSACGPAFAGSTCQRITSTCGGLPAYTAQVVITDPGATPNGTVVLLQGSGGQGIPSGPSWDPVVAGLVSGGRRVVRFGGYAGASWESGGVAEGSCRIAEILDWIRQTYHVGGPFCGVGSSGGSSAFAYVMTLHPHGLDGVVMVNGAPLTSLSTGCTSAPAATIPNGCQGAPHAATYPAGTAGGVDAWESTTSCATAAQLPADVARWQANDAAFAGGDLTWGGHVAAITCSGTAIAHGQLELLMGMAPGITRTCLNGCTGEAVLNVAPGRSAVIAAALACGGNP